MRQSNALYLNQYVRQQILSTEQNLLSVHLRSPTFSILYALPQLLQRLLTS